MEYREIKQWFQLSAKIRFRYHSFSDVFLKPFSPILHYSNTPIIDAYYDKSLVSLKKLLILLCVVLLITNKYVPNSPYGLDKGGCFGVVL